MHHGWRKEETRLLHDTRRCSTPWTDSLPCPSRACRSEDIGHAYSCSIQKRSISPSVRGNSCTDNTSTWKTRNNTTCWKCSLGSADSGRLSPIGLRLGDNGTKQVHVNGLHRGVVQDRQVVGIQNAGQVTPLSLHRTLQRTSGILAANAETARERRYGLTTNKELPFSFHAL